MRVIIHKHSSHIEIIYLSLQTIGISYLVSFRSQAFILYKWKEEEKKIF